MQMFSLVLARRKETEKVTREEKERIWSLDLGKVQPEELLTANRAAEGEGTHTPRSLRHHNSTVIYHK